jgi:hypothetical protein
MSDGGPEKQGSGPNTCAFLVRIWRDSEASPWRASVTHVVSGDSYKFADAQLVWAHILRQLQGKDKGEEATDAE